MLTLLSHVSESVSFAGGPGCSSELAVFYENGPFHIKEDLSVASNPYGWDVAGNIIFVDQVFDSTLGKTFTDHEKHSGKPSLDCVADQHGLQLFDGREGPGVRREDGCI